MKPPGGLTNWVVRCLAGTHNADCTCETKPRNLAFQNEIFIFSTPVFQVLGEFFPRIALAIGVLTSNRRGGAGIIFGGCFFDLFEHLGSRHYES